MDNIKLPAIENMFTEDPIQQAEAEQQKGEKPKPLENIEFSEHLENVSNTKAKKVTNTDINKAYVQYRVDMNKEAVANGERPTRNCLVCKTPKNTEINLKAHICKGCSNVVRYVIFLLLFIGFQEFDLM